jgi:hypothetical protein
VGVYILEKGCQPVSRQPLPSILRLAFTSSSPLSLTIHLAPVGAQLGRQQVLQPGRLEDTLLAKSNKKCIFRDQGLVYVKKKH